MRTYLAWSGIAALGAILVSSKWKKSRKKKQRVPHVSESEIAYRRAGKRLLILGAGFGGLATALELDRQLRSSAETSILVLDRNNDLLFTPLLWTVANGRASPNGTVVPIRDFQKGRRFHVLHAEIAHIDLDRRVVETSAGSRPYDRLVIALGSHTTLPHLPGLRDHALPFHTPADALQLRNHLIDAIESAHQAAHPQERQAWLTFVVGGAGDTGIELAAIIHEYLTAALFRDYPWLHDAPIRVIVVGRSDRVLPMSELPTSRLVQQTLEEAGIEVLTGTSVTAVTATTVETNRGSIPARTLFWAAGITAPAVVRGLPVQHAPNGAILVDDYLRIPGYPEVSVIGDSAWAYDPATGSPIPPTAQAARQQGTYVGQVIASAYAGRPVMPYRYTPLGHLALLGHATGVARIGPFTFTGPAAWIGWHLVYLWRNPSWNKRIRLVSDWLLSALLGRETGQLRLNTSLPQPERMPASLPREQERLAHSTETRALEAREIQDPKDDEKAKSGGQRWCEQHQR